MLNLNRKKESRRKDMMGTRRHPSAPAAPKQIILRDELALDRTHLANDRTLLAYVRTALALLLAGVTFVYFSKELWFSVVGTFCLILGAIALGIGVWRYRQMKSKLRLFSSAAGPPGDADFTDHIEEVCSTEDR